MISVVILTKNEENNIAECLQNLSWCDERIVIDDESTDKTVHISKKHGATVYSHLSNGDFASQRNFGLEKAKGEWVLFIDADERVSDALAYEIMQHVNNAIDPYSGYFLKRIDKMWNSNLEHGEIGGIQLLRLAKKEAGHWIGKVHEKWQVKGTTHTLNNPLIHYPHQAITEFLQEINIYTDIRANELYENKITSNFFTIILYPTSKFIYNYFLRRGFQDGIPGLIIAIMMSFHSFLVRGKLWLLWQKKPK